MAKKTSLNLALLATIVAASVDGATPGYTYVSDADAKPLLDKGLIEQNPTPEAVNSAGERQTRSTAAGNQFVTENSTTGEKETSVSKEPKEKPVFALGIVDVPEIKRGGGLKPSVFPFDELGIKGVDTDKPNSFFIPATAGREDPAKAFASTVSGMNRKHSVQDGTKEITDKKTGAKKSVPNMKPTKKFAIRPAADGGAWNPQYKGVKGAAVYRTL